MRADQSECKLPFSSGTDCLPRRRHSMGRCYPRVTSQVIFKWSVTGGEKGEFSQLQQTFVPLPKTTKQQTNKQQKCQNRLELGYTFSKGNLPSGSLKFKDNTQEQRFLPSVLHPKLLPALPSCTVRVRGK